MSAFITLTCDSFNCPATVEAGHAGLRVEVATELAVIHDGWLHTSHGEDFCPDHA